MFAHPLNGALTELNAQPGLGAELQQPIRQCLRISYGEQQS